MTISYRTAAMGFKWPDRVKEVPLLKEMVEGMGPYGPTQDAIFVDGTRVCDVHAVILCTGYLHSFPFLEDSLRLKATNILYPDGLYKGVVWRKNTDLHYIGMQDQWYTFSYFDLQALLAKDIILGRIALPDEDGMDSDMKTWKEKGDGSKSDEEQIGVFVPCGGSFSLSLSVSVTLRICQMARVSNGIYVGYLQSVERRKGIL